MSQTKATQIATKVNEVYSSFVDILDLDSEKDSNFNDKLTSRCLASFGISYICDDTTPKVCGGSVVDGGGDNGVDAIYFDGKRDRLVIVQSKFIKDGVSEPSLAEIKKFKDGVFDLLDGKLHKFNDKIKSKRSEIASINRFGVKVDIVLVYTGKKNLAGHASEEIEEMLKKLNGEDEDSPVYFFHKVSIDKIFEKLSRGDGGPQIDLEYHLSEWAKIERPYVSYYGRIKGDVLAEWWRDYRGRLFDDNIRQLLGDTEVNSQIRETVQNDPENFWYYNNGVTLLCDSVSKTVANRDNRDWGQFSSTNASVVNGAQTVGVLGSLFEKGVDLAKVEVPFRAITVEDGEAGLRKLITRYNNTQNAILSKDFVAQDPIQDDLQAQVAILGFRYQVQRSESFVSSDINFNFDEVLEGLIVLSDKVSYAATFRKEISRFYIVDKTPYMGLFNKKTSGFRIINAVKFLRVLDEACQNISTDLEEDSEKGRKLQVVNNGKLVVGIHVFRMLDGTSRINDELLDFSLSEVQKLFSKYVNIVFDKCEDFYPSAYLRTLFQNVTKCEKVDSSIRLL